MVTFPSMLQTALLQHTEASLPHSEGNEKNLIKAGLGSATSEWKKPATINKQGPELTLIKHVVAQHISKCGCSILVLDY